jgi:hypothetical protein
MYVNEDWGKAKITGFRHCVTLVSGLSLPFVILLNEVTVGISFGDFVGCRLFDTSAFSTFCVLSIRRYGASPASALYRVDVLTFGIIMSQIIPKDYLQPAAFMG